MTECQMVVLENNQFEQNDKASKVAHLLVVVAFQSSYWWNKYKIAFNFIYLDFRRRKLSNEDLLGDIEFVDFEKTDC